jgi:hypothetical protein
VQTGCSKLVRVGDVEWVSSRRAPRPFASIRIGDDAPRPAQRLVRSSSRFSCVRGRAPPRQAIPGVEDAGITNALPLGRTRTRGTQAKGASYESGTAPSAFIHVVGDGYATAMGLPLRVGRDFSESNTPSSELW